MNARPGSENAEVRFADFERYFPHTPTALCLKECARLTELRRHPCPGPILDVGCGDGLFAKVAFDDVEIWGIDIDANESRWAAIRRSYAQVITGDVTTAKLPEGFFATCVANCSLEHVPRIDLALETIRRSLKPGGRAYLFVPNRDWAAHLLSVRLLQRLGARDLGEMLQRSIDSFFKHHHLYDADGWREVVLQAGLEAEAIEPVLSTATTTAFEAFLLPSALGWVNKHMTTRWTNFPRFRQVLAGPTFRLVDALLKAGDPQPSAEFLVVARRPEA